MNEFLTQSNNKIKRGSTMKKLILAIIIFMSLSSITYSKFKHEPFIDAKAGLNVQNYTNIAFVDLTIGYRFEFDMFKLEAFGNLNTYFVTTESIMANYPFRSIYTVGARIYVSNFYVEFEHACSHAVASYALQYVPRDMPYNHFTNTFGWSKTTISIGFKFN